MAIKLYNSFKITDYLKAKLKSHKNTPITNECI